MRGSRSSLGVALGAAALGVALSSLLTASCSLLVQFHDQAVGCDGRSCKDDGSAPDGGGPDAADDGGGPDVVVVDTGVPEQDASKPPCFGKRDGYYCGDNGLNPPGLPANQIVHCVGNQVGTATVCPGGCLHVIDPLPDACNPCMGLANGSYCGSEFEDAGFPADNGSLLVPCNNGIASTTNQTDCVNGCMSSGAMSSCM